MAVILHQDESLEGALLLIGFPSRGLVGGVAANFVIQQLGMRHIAGLYDARLPPTVAVRQGTAHSPIRFFASDERCGPDKTCNRLVAAVSDIPLPAEVLLDIAYEMVAWAKEHKISNIVVLEGVKGNNAVQHRNGSKGNKTTPRVRGVRSLESKVDLPKYDVELVQDAMVSSYAAAFLLAANELGADLVALFTESRSDIPDHQAAATLLNHVDPLLPNIDFNATYLRQRAKALENDMKATIKSSARELQAMRKPNEIMYA